MSTDVFAQLSKDLLLMTPEGLTTELEFHARAIRDAKKRNPRVAACRSCGEHRGDYHQRFWCSLCGEPMGPCCTMRIKFPGSHRRAELAICIGCRPDAEEAVKAIFLQGAQS